MNWFLSRLREPSTWRGLVWLATVAGMSLRPDQAEAIVAAGMALAGLLGVFLSDEPSTIRIELPPIDLQGRSEPGNAGSGAGAVRPADGVRLPANRAPGPAKDADAKALGVGFGDRD